MNLRKSKMIGFWKLIRCLSSSIETKYGQSFTFRACMKQIQCRNKEFMSILLRISSQLGGSAPHNMQKAAGAKRILAARVKLETTKYQHKKRKQPRSLVTIVDGGLGRMFTIKCYMF